MPPHSPACADSDCDAPSTGGVETSIHANPTRPVGWVNVFRLPTRVRCWFGMRGQQVAYLTWLCPILLAKLFATFALGLVLSVAQAGQYAYQSCSYSDLECVHSAIQADLNAEWGGLTTWCTGTGSQGPGSGLPLHTRKVRVYGIGVNG